MTIGNLKDLIDSLPEEAEIRIMSQQNWPFEYSIAGLWEATDEDDFTPVQSDPKEATPVVYLVEGTQLGYGAKIAWEEYQR